MTKILVVVSRECQWCGLVHKSDSRPERGFFLSFFFAWADLLKNIRLQVEAFCLNTIWVQVLFLPSSRKISFFQLFTIPNSNNNIYIPINPILIGIAPVNSRKYSFRLPINIKALIQVVLPKMTVQPTPLINHVKNRSLWSLNNFIGSTNSCKIILFATYYFN